MARYTGPMTKKSRRLGVDLVGGDQAFERRPYPPGQHGRGRIKESEYLLQLREKQKARFTYGVLEKQFHNYYTEANRRPARPVTTCCSSSSAASTTSSTAPASPARRRHARQLVVHGHFLVNGHKVDIPSFQVTAHDIIDVREKSPRDDPVHRGSRDPRRARSSRPGSRPSRRGCASWSTSSRSGPRSTSRSRSSSSSSTTRRSDPYGSPARGHRPTPVASSLGSVK